MKPSLKILVAGASGQVACALTEVSQRALGIDLTAMGRRDGLDILQSESFEAALEDIRPDIVVNAAAYTAVDRAEGEREAAFALNARAATDLAIATAAQKIPIIHFSTDYVFNGLSQTPYVETDSVDPTSIYGSSKLAGERGVTEANPRHIILRTSWVYSPFGSNFVKTMLRVGAERDELDVVDDQTGSPTSALDIADGVISIARQLSDKGKQFPAGIYHMCGSGNGTWADLATEVFSASAKLGGPIANVNRVMSDAYPTPVTRPKNSRLDCSKLTSRFAVRLPEWRKSTQATVERLLKSESQNS